MGIALWAGLFMPLSLMHCEIGAWSAINNRADS
jgi:hypothetical protein